MQYLELPRTLAVGDFIAFVHDEMEANEHLTKRYTFSGSVFFERMKNLDLYSTDPDEIRDRVALAGLSGVFSQSLV